MRQERTHWCTAVYCLSTGNLVTVYPGYWGIYMIAGMNTGVCWYWTICDMFFFVEMYFVRHGGCSTMKQTTSKPLQYVADPLRLFDQVVWPDGCIVSFMSPLARSPRLVPALVKCLFSMTLVVLFVASNSEYGYRERTLWPKSVMASSALWWSHTHSLCVGKTPLHFQLFFFHFPSPIFTKKPFW